MNRKKVLLIVSVNTKTIGRLSHNLYRALVVLPNVEVRVALIYKCGDVGYSFGECEVFARDRLPGIIEQSRLIRKVLWIRRIRKSFNPDITIGTQFVCSTISVLSGGGERKIGIFHSPHMQTRDRGILLYGINVLIYRLIYPRLSKLYCVSEEVRDSIRAHFPMIDPCKLEVVYNIHNVEEIRTLGQEPLSIEEMRAFAHPVVLFCGRLEPNKAPERLLFAVGENATLFSKPPNLVFIGRSKDGMAEKLRKLAVQLGIENRVYILGEQSNPYKFMSLARVVVSCSFSEGLPGVLIESLLLHTPIVSTNSSKGVWEILGVQEGYSTRLRELVITGNGVISPNLSYYDKSIREWDWDTLHLAKGIAYVLNTDLRGNDFRFENEVSGSVVAKRYVDC